jgi:hypothetical protein
MSNTSHEIKTDDEIMIKVATVVQATVIDLSKAIDESIARDAGEEVRSVRVFDDNYRCNWWVRDAAPGAMYLNTGRIIRSKFLRANMSGDTLVIEDRSSHS